MKHVKLFEQFVNEATTSWKKMMQGVRASETGPWSIVAVQDRKVVGQSIDIRIQDLIPAKYEALKKEFPKAKLHIEDGTGMVVWNEGIANLHDAAARYKNKLNEAKFKVGDKWEWNHADGVKTVEITNVKSNGDVVGREDGSSEDFIVRDANKYLKKKVTESIVNEDSSTTFLILMQAAIVNGMLIGQMAANSGGGDGFHPIDDLKAWWQKRKSDKALKSIIDKIKDDEDVVKFMKLTPSQQRGKFRSLIATKLNDEELEYLNKINRSHFQTESVVNEARKQYKVMDVTVDGNPVIEFQNLNSKTKWIENNPDAIIQNIKTSSFDADQKRIVGTSRGPFWIVIKPDFNESLVNEAKNLTREELVKILQTKYALNFTKDSEEFDGEEGGIWIGGSEGLVMPDGKTEMFNYYHGGSKFPQGINKDFANFLAKRGWYGQFADPGTVLLWPAGSNESIDITHTKDSDTLAGNPGEDTRMLNVRAFRGTVADLTSFVNDKIGK
jgi:hypothetical protein